MPETEKLTEHDPKTQYEPMTEKKARRKRFLHWSLYGVYILAFLLVGTAIGFIGNGVLWEIVDPFASKDPEDVFGQPSLNLLILGTDEDRLPGGQRIARSSARSDMVMVVRELASYRVEDCDELDADRGSSTELCYQPNRAWDMFDLEGNYLGVVKRPEGRLFRPYLRGNLMLLHVEDEFGTIMVKRYELTPPSAGSQ